MVRHASSHASNGSVIHSGRPGVAAGVSLTPDVELALVAAVAQELHKIHGGNEVLDWLEAEMLVQSMFESGEAREHSAGT